MPTPLRAVRVPADLWLAAQAVAERNGESVSGVVRAALVAYVASAPERKADTSDE